MGEPSDKPVVVARGPVRSAAQILLIMISAFSFASGCEVGQSARSPWHVAEAIFWPITIPYIEARAYWKRRWEQEAK